MSEGAYIIRAELLEHQRLMAAKDDIIKQLMADIEQLCVKVDDGVQRNDWLSERRGKDLADLAAARKAIATFCAESEWAAPSWKEQPHIKALFDITTKEPK